MTRPRAQYEPFTDASQRVSAFQRSKQSLLCLDGAVGPFEVVKEHEGI